MEYLTIKDIAKHLGVTTRMVTHLRANRGIEPVAIIGRSYLFTPDQLPLFEGDRRYGPKRPKDDKGEAKDRKGEA